MTPKKLLKKIVSSPTNVKFKDFVRLVESVGFVLDRVSGSHHLFVHPLIPEVLNIQNAQGEAKPYQIRQFLKLLEAYNMA